MADWNRLRPRLILAALGVLLVGALVFVLLRSGPLAPTRVTVAAVKVERVQQALFGIGTVEARRSYLVGPTVAGRVRSVAVDVGEAVRAGQPLAEMDPVDLDERVRALDASMARAESAVTASEAQRRDALARRELAVSNLRRYADLGAQNFISAGAVEARQQEQTSAEAQVRAADANLAAARQDRQRLSAERAGLLQQRANVRLTAPTDGVVTSRDAEPGTTVIAGQAVLKLVDPASLWVRVRLDQGRSAGLAPGLPAQVALRSRPGQALAGRVARVEAVSDSVTEERIAQVAFDARPEALSIGELAEVTITLAPSEEAPVIPNAALKRQGEQWGVWRIEQGDLRFVPVTPGARSLDGRVQVREGLSKGDSVVVYSEKALRAGSRVRVVDALVEARP